MKITQVRLGRISTPLRVPFKTALRTVNSVEDVIVELHTDTGAVGYGEAPPTGVITGDTTGAILGAIQDHIAPALLGRDLDEFEDLTAAVQKALVHNTSAKAAVDMALWDLLGQKYSAPVYRMLGGARKNIVTDILSEESFRQMLRRRMRNTLRIFSPTPIPMVTRTGLHGCTERRWNDRILWRFRSEQGRIVWKMTKFGCYRS